MHDEGASDDIEGGFNFFVHYMQTSVAIKFFIIWLDPCYYGMESCSFPLQKQIWRVAYIILNMPSYFCLHALTLVGSSSLSVQSMMEGITERVVDSGQKHATRNLLCCIGFSPEVLEQVARCCPRAVLFNTVHKSEWYKHVAIPIVPAFVRLN